MKRLVLGILCGLLVGGAAFADGVAQVEFHCTTGLFETGLNDEFGFNFEPAFIPVPVGIVKYEYWTPLVPGKNRVHLGVGAIALPVPNIMLTGGFSYPFSAAAGSRRHWELNFSASLGVISVVSSSPVYYEESETGGGSDEPEVIEIAVDSGSTGEMAKSVYSSYYGSSSDYDAYPIPFYELSMMFAWVPNNSGIYFAVGPAVVGVTNLVDFNVGAVTLQFALGWKH